MVQVDAPIADSLSAYKTEDLTLHIGTQFTNSEFQIAQVINSPHADKIFKELSTLISQRGVVFFKAQNLTPAELKVIGQRLGEAGGKPATSGLHRHPISQEDSPLGGEISIISSEGGIARQGYEQKGRASRQWHTDITFEKVPSDYTLLKMHTLPPVGGDTLWASGYEAYDRLSPSFKTLLEGLTAVHDGNGFVTYAREHNIPILSPRGTTENVGEDLVAIHPVIRSHPITGWKTLFINRGFTKRIVELAVDESDTILQFLFDHIAENHDLQVRYKWSLNDLAVWDNRCTFHAATFDYQSKRVGDRVVSLGEKPYYDPSSGSRREALQLNTV